MCDGFRSRGERSGGRKTLGYVWNERRGCVLLGGRVLRDMGVGVEVELDVLRPRRERDVQGVGELPMAVMLGNAGRVAVIMCGSHRSGYSPVWYGGTTPPSVSFNAITMLASVLAVSLHLLSRSLILTPNSPGDPETSAKTVKEWS